MRLFIDWETTDIYLKGEPSENPGQPWPCSVSAILDDDAGKTWAEYYSLIHVPREVQWAPKAFETNKLTHDLCERYGVRIQTALAQVADMLTAAEEFIAFSSFFDGKFYKIACAKVGGDEGAAARTVYEGKRRLCTMEASARHFTGPDARFIKLKLAYEKAFGSMFEGAHGAHADNHAQRRLYYWLKKQGCADFGDTEVVTQRAPTLKPTADVPSAKSKPGKPGAISF